MQPIKTVCEIRCDYFATNNRVSPFVLLIGDWPKRARMRKACVAGQHLGWRKALPCEVEALEKSTRHVAYYWPTLREMLWDHRGPDLEDYYLGLVAAIRRLWPAIKRCQAVVAKKKEQRRKDRLAVAEIVAENRRREKAARDPQLQLFGAA